MVGPLMSIVTSFGLLYICGLRFSGLLATVPFMVISIGIDDSFVVLAALRHTDYNQKYSERVAVAVANSGGPITVISITDVICFVVGMQSSIYGVTLFW